MVEIALFEPDIPQNVGTILRTADCLGVKVHIIEPCGFIFSNNSLKRSAMDYLETVDYLLHDDFNHFLEYVKKNEKRIVLATTKSSVSYYKFDFYKNDILLFGKESKGVPNYVHDQSDARIRINMVPNKRSLNLAVSVGIITAEAIKKFS